MTFYDFVKLSKIKHNCKYEYTNLTEKYFNGSHSKIPIYCPKHGYFWQIARNHFKSGNGCPKCAIKYRAEENTLSTEEFIAKAKKIHGNKYNYSKSIYKGTKIPIEIICPKHGEFWQTPNDHLNGKGCPFCNESHLEKELKKQFEENDIKFEEHKHFDWLGKQEIDFYLSDYNIGIECQGKQHFGFGGWSDKFNFEKQFKLDENKYDLCNLNKINLIYYASTKYYNNINEKIYKKDNVFFNLKDILNYVKAFKCANVH